MIALDRLTPSTPFHILLSVLAMLVASAILPDAVDAQVTREGRVGTITATIDGEARTFPVIGRVSGERTEWGSVWAQNGPQVGMSIWGVAGSVDTAENDDAILLIGLGFRLSERDPDATFADLPRACDPFVDRVQYSLDGTLQQMMAEECGGIQVESMSYDEATETFAVAGTFSGQVDDGGPTISDGTFEATLSRRP